MIDSSHEGPSFPASHYFVAVAHASRCRTIRVRASVARIGISAVVVLALWGVVSAVYLGFHDDVVATLVSDQARMQYAYEDRIAALRSQVDQEASQHLTGQSALEAQLHALAQRAGTLETRAALITQLASRTGALPRDAQRPVVVPGALSSYATPSSDGTGALPEPGAFPPIPFSSQNKPHPEAAADPLGGATDVAASIDLRVASLTARLENVDATQYRGLADIAMRARKTADLYREAIAEAGLSPDRFEHAKPPVDVGGPFVPLDDGLAASPFGHALSALQGDVTAVEQLRTAVPKVPFASPLLGAAEVTSPFGPRLDPFLGRPALHTGVDLRESFGTDVRVTADGRVVSAGPAGGYGNMIEVDHGNGLATRYAHLSEIAVAPGERVTRGQIIGQVGATGRATGPHLHYETRIDGEPVNPMRFLDAGEKLAGNL